MSNNHLPEFPTSPNNALSPTVKMPQPVQISLTKSKPVTPAASLFRYELFVLLVWFCVELARWYSRDMVLRKLTGDGEINKRLPLKKTMSYGVLIGAMVGAFLFWLIVDVLCYDSFHSEQEVYSISSSGATIVNSKRIN